MKKLLLTTAAAMLLTLSASAKKERKIEADFNQVKNAKSEAYFKCVGAGRAAEALRSDWREQMDDIQENFPYEYVRFHALLHDDMGVCTKRDGKLIYNFQYIDDLYDYLLSVNIKPFVELSFMPDVMKSGDKTVFWWKGNVTPPANYDEWEELISRLVTHLTKRYGAEEVKTWYFEVWNEPNHPTFFSADRDEYFKMYETAARAIRAVNSEYRVGGPATAGNAWITDLIDFCGKNDVPLDFLSTHNYGVTGALDEFGVRRLLLKDDYEELANSVNRTYAKIEDKSLEFHYTEWNSSFSPRDLVHDTYLNATHILNVLRDVNGTATSMSYWTFTDVFEETGIPTTPLHGGFGLINLQGLRKPTYFAYKYLYQLGESELVSNDADSWVCRGDDGSVQVLAYNYTHPKYGKGEVNNTYFNRIQEPKSLDDLKVDIKGIPDGTYRYELYSTGYDRNDIQSAYFRMGAPDILYPEQEETLRLASQDKPLEIAVIEIRGGQFTKSYAMRENDIYFVKLTPLF